MTLTRRTFAHAVAALAFAASLAAGKSFADGEEPGAMLRDVEWRITTIAGAPLAEGTQATITFSAEDRFGGRACNTFGGGYTLKGDTIKIGPVASTMMACEEPEMKQEHALFQSLENAASWSVGDDGTLTLAEAGGAAIITATK